nr:MbnP family protein [uncultured Flavobacterium sp.]
MKNIVYKALLILAVSAFITGCSSDDNENNAAETGKIGLKFDNSYASNDLILNTQTNTTANNEKLKISLVKYIVSNIVLTKADGTTFTYPKAKSYFIADEDSEAGYKFELTDVPTGDYTKVKFGIGVDKEQWQLGASGQGDFLAQAQAEDLLWSWSAGYKFFAFEGTFTSATVTTATSFMIHTGQTGTAYNYTEVTLDLPTKALVRGNISPDIHIVTDLSKILDGQNTIKLSDNNMGGMGAMIMGGTILESITTNISKMFRVDHVHND